MGKYNRKGTGQVQPGFTRPAMGPMRTTAAPTLRTHEGAPAYAKDAKTELFQLAVTSMMGEDAFYETAKARDGRLVRLVREVAVADPAWMLGFAGWLRGEANMRSASLVLAAEAVKARLDAKAGDRPERGPALFGVQAPDPVGYNRQIVASVLQRADEPGEMLAYWTATHGRNVPKPVKRGVADAVQRLYTEYSLLKYDTPSHGFRFADVLDMTHPEPKAPWQGELFKYALDRRHGRDLDTFGGLSMVQASEQLRADVNVFPEYLLDAGKLKAAGFTWEDALSLAGSKVDKRRLWEAMIPSMGYMALLRNLRNFDEASVSDNVAAQVAAKLADPAEVARSRQLPFRFYSAYLAAPSDRWKHALGVALDLAMSNVPALPGRTVVMIDTSGSMTGGTISARSQVTPAQAAAVLGITLAKRVGADVVQWADDHQMFRLKKGASGLSEIARFLSYQGAVGYGTNLAGALRAVRGYDRVFVLSDFQTATYAEGIVPAHVPVYAFDLAGYRGAAFSTKGGNRHQLGGYTDRVFGMVELLERGQDAPWPWEITADVTG